VGGAGAAGASTTKGLFIPRGSDIGLSELPVSALIQNIMKWLLYIVGFVAIIAFVISGMQYLLAAGSEEMAKKAKANMQYAMLGVLVALSALIVIRAIQSVLSGTWMF
jgi:cytochrome bd-type quinol oxidase subunit 2